MRSDEPGILQSEAADAKVAPNPAKEIVIARNEIRFESGAPDPKPTMIWYQYEGWLYVPVSA